MTHITTDAPLIRSRHRPPRTEYAIYFALIFAVSLPGSVLAWAMPPLRSRRQPGRGPLAGALSHARTITPQIFSA